MTAEERANRFAWRWRPKIACEDLEFIRFRDELTAEFRGMADETAQEAAKMLDGWWRPVESPPQELREQYIHQVCVTCAEARRFALIGNFAECMVCGTSFVYARS